MFAENLMPKRRPFRSRIPLRRMNNPIVGRPHDKFWLVFSALFVFWYFLLYVGDWSSFPGLTSMSHNEANSLESSGFNSVHTKSYLNGNANSKVIGIGDIIRSNESRNASRKVIDGERNFDEKSSENYDPSDQNDDPSARETVFTHERHDVFGKRRNMKSCMGRYIYVHELPSRFNDDLLRQCKLLSKWTDMCQYLVNMGLGPDLGNSRPLMSIGWFATNQFSLEIIFHNRMKNYDCITNDSSKAAAIYVPYYAGLDIARYLWDSHSISTRDAASLDLMEWLRLKPEWGRMGGRDHFLVVGRITWDFRRGVDEDSAWGNKLMLLPETQNMTMLTIESSPWNRNDFAIPYPTYFHPSRDDEVFRWQNRMKKAKRKNLFAFVGGQRPNLENDFRSELMKQCVASRQKCKLLECKSNGNKCSKPMYVMKVFQTSIFCLQPPGDSFTRRSIFDSIVAGCVPVFFSPGSAYVQYLWHLPKDCTKYSVLISEDDVKAKKVNIEHILSRIPRSEVSAMQEEVIKLIPKVIYAYPRSSLETLEDAFDLTVKGVLERTTALRKEIREGKNSSFSFDEENSWKYYTFGTVEKHEWDDFFRRTNKEKY